MANINKTAKEIEELLDKVDLIADYPIEIGEEQGWTYKKMASGEAICYRQVIHEDISITTTWTNDWRYRDLDAVQYPFEFKYVPHCITDVYNTEVTTLHTYAEIGTVNRTPKVRLLTQQSATVRALGVVYYVIGRWK